MALPFENDTSQAVKKLAKRSLAAEKRRNLFVCCTIAFAVALMAAVSFVAIAQKAKSVESIRGQYQVMVQSTQERIDNLTAQPEVERWGLSKNYPISRYRDSVLTVLYADDNWMTLGNMPAVKGQMPQQENEILVESKFLDYFHLPQEYGQVIAIDLGYGEQAYTVTGILQTENLSRLFEVVVSKAFVIAHSEETPEFEFRMRYSGGNQMDASRLKDSILTFLAAWDIPENDILFSTSYFNMEGFRVAAGGYAIPVALLILFACGIVIYNIFYISVKGKVKEYGRLKVIGTTPKQLERMVRYESLVLSILGIPIGLLIGSVIAFVSLPAYWNWMQNGIATIIIFIMTELMIFLSTYTSVRMAAKVSPIEATRVVYATETNQAATHRPHQRITPSNLAKLNFKRSRKKVVITLASLGFSGILLLTAATLFRSIDFESMAAQMMGDNGNYSISRQDSVEMEKIQEQARDNPLSDDLYKKIIALPEVDAITSYSAVTAEITLPRKADMFIITAMTRDQLVQQLPKDPMLEGTADYDALVENNGILISDSSDHILSHYYDYTPQIGDVLQLKTYGGQDMDVTVMGIVKEGSRGPTGVLSSVLILPEDTLHKLYPGIQNFQIAWNVHTSQDSDTLRTSLFQIAEDPALTILARSDFITSLQANMRQMVMLVYYFTGFLFIFALINLVNTLMTNLLSRRQELGILQSVGMTHKQLSRMLSSECGRYVVGTLGLTAIVGGGCGAILVQILNHFKVMGTLNYNFPFLELAVFAFALLMIHFLYVFAAIRYTKQQPIVDSIKASE